MGTDSSMEESRTTLNHVNTYTVIVKPVDPHLRTRFLNHVIMYTVIVKPVDQHLGYIHQTVRREFLVPVVGRKNQRR